MSRTVETLQRQRAREADRKVLPPLAKRFTTAVVGVTFAPWYPDNLVHLAELAREAEGPSGMEPLPALIVRRPDNPHDANACEVHVPAVGQIGHVPAAVAARLAPFLDGGGVVVASVTGVRIDPRHPDRPGIDVEVRRA